MAETNTSGKLAMAGGRTPLSNGTLVSGFIVDGKQVVGVRGNAVTNGAAVSNAANSLVIADALNALNVQFNLALVELRAHGLIA